MRVFGNQAANGGSGPIGSRPVAVVTGASSGIGAEFARELAASYDLVLVARRQKLLELLAAEIMAQHRTRPVIAVADLCCEVDRTSLCQLLKNEPRLSLLVNNAGFGVKAPLWSSDLATLQHLHAIHTTSVLELCHAALAPMISRNFGAIINVASVGAILQRPNNAAYGAAKRWIISFTEGLNLDLRRAGSAVAVQVLCPGYTYSEFHDALAGSREALAPKLFWLEPSYVVKRSLRALRQKQMIVVPGMLYRIAVSLMSCLPYRLRMGIESHLP